jgi:sugar phosphate isomerase/epimerase
MNSPKIAMCNFIPDAATLRQTAVQHGFSGVDWTFDLEGLPRNQIEESRLLRDVSSLKGLEVRYHCAFKGVDLGDEVDLKAAEAMEVFKKACRVVSRLEGRFMTVHLGLGRKSPAGLSWNRTINGLAELVSYAQELGVRLCLENLASGWSSRPQLFEKLVRKTNAGITLDIGHARVCHSVQCRIFDLEDFVMPHPERAFNAHIYHEELYGRHVPPVCLDDVRGRLDLLSSLSCNWWVLELREEAPLLTTLRIVREYLESRDNEAQSS